MSRHSLVVKVFGTRVSDHNSEQGNFFQALIQLTAANLKYFLGNPAAAQNLFRSGIIRLQNVPSSYMGIDVPRLTKVLHAHLISPHPHALLIDLGQIREKQEVEQPESNGRTRNR